ncbi:azurin [Pseudoxanthomonas sp. GM95]|uniref:azurin n=1 Tax=Pseudoxanthomonas sp. GM95 TaxID=1881043 RepID=UPI0008C9099B|nr:azurin [Pseudoxanthomonas sp. GM95]SEL61233.1 azurin [Pseudoxanthomonas sp. GM95]
MKNKTLWATLALIAGGACAQGASAKTCAVEVSSTDAMRFDKTELKVDASCTEVKLTLVHAGKLPVNIMGHNVVVAKTADVAEVTSAGIKAGAASDYVAADDKAVIAHTKLIGGGQSTTLTFSTKGLTKGGDYSFFCSFPGHSSLMKGKFVFG